jgi:hypothetical protein
MQDHPLVNELMHELLMLDGKPQPPPRPMIDRFVKQATALTRGEDIYAVVKNVGALASAFEAAGHKAVCDALVSTLPALLAHLTARTEAELKGGAGMRSRKGH